ncbi:ARM repeat-containing protein [Auricularia subglabra TFB-10046 SS5]|nr:ARM repeat-containing protein [Auricularia subglabra TFB-10046 SS5]
MSSSHGGGADRTAEVPQSAMPEPTGDPDSVYSSFEKADEFFERLDAFLALDLSEDPATPEQKQKEWFAGTKLRLILIEYQEQAFLLDPYIERMVAPPVNALRQHVNAVVNSGAKWSKSRLSNLAELIYSFCRVRGHKTIVRFFPHEVTDLPIAIAYMSLENGPVTQNGWWNLRYVMLLWLSLIAMIPFDLNRFDDPSTPGKTLRSIETFGREYITFAGIERDIAAIMLARLYTRKDTAEAYRQFLEYAKDHVDDPQQLFPALGILRMLCESCNYQSSDQLGVNLTAIREIADRSQALASNTSVRKLRTKLISRVAMKLLPPPKPRRRKGRGLMTADEALTTEIETTVHEQDVPEEVEATVADVLMTLEDKDTPLRSSAAKALACLAERLPREFSDQILEQVLGVFAEHSWKSNDEMLDLPASAEYSWHGACLACAEFTRRDLVPPSRLPNMIPWIVKALHFDIRKGTHSVGSSVRDAAAYVLWSLARSPDVDAIRPFSDELARELVLTAIYDREVHIRRAASAAFQESVGRMGLFPDGITVLAKIDFFAVGIRRNAFTTAAAEVAKFPAYRQALLDHVIEVVIRHWDPDMRQLGALSLRAVCSVDHSTSGSEAVRRLADALTSMDIFTVNGALLGLAELAAMYSHLGAPKEGTDDKLHEIFSTLSRVPDHMFRSRQSDLVLEGYCLVISKSINAPALSSTPDKSRAMPQWRSVIEQTLRSRSPSVQESAALAMRRVSQLKECSADVKRFIRDFTGGLPLLQQGVSRILGLLAYDKHQHGVSDAIQCLLNAVDSKGQSFSQFVESRQKAYEALPSILATLGPRITSHCGPLLIRTIYRSLIAGLDDYTSDERGDVGSWIRIACISGLVSVSRLLFDLAAQGDIDLADYLPQTDYHEALGGLLKQGVERLDNVRAHAGEQTISLVEHPHPNGWVMAGEALFRGLFLKDGEERTSWADAAHLFPKAVQLLAIPQYRATLTYGFVLSIGSKTDSTQRPASKALADFATSLPTATDKSLELTTPGIVQEVLTIGKRNFAANHIAVPVYQTLAVLLESGAVGNLEASPEGVQALSSIHQLAAKNAEKLKNVQRILAAMKIVTALVPIRSVSKDAVKTLPVFLGHRFPKVRAETAETLYLVTQTRDIEAPEVEDLLLETEWTGNVSHEVEQVVELLLNM